MSKGNRPGRSRRVSLTARLFLFGFCMWPSTALLAQDVREEVTHTTVQGVVRDADSGTPVAGARVRLQELRRGILSDERGRFEFENVPVGIQVLSVDQYGYSSLEATFDTGTGGDVTIDMELPPLPVMLDGVTVVADRLALMNRRLTNRRRAFASSSRAFEQGRLVRSTATDMRDFLQTEALLTEVACPEPSFGSVCVLRRGRAVEPRVYIDEAPVIGGADMLATYRPYDLYLVEIFSQGLEIRAYTHMFMERMARRPMVLIPLEYGPR